MPDEAPAPGFDLDHGASPTDRLASAETRLPVLETDRDREAHLRPLRAAHSLVGASGRPGAPYVSPEGSEARRSAA